MDLIKAALMLFMEREQNQADQQRFTLDAFYRTMKDREEAHERQDDKSWERHQIEIRQRDRRIDELQKKLQNMKAPRIQQVPVQQELPYKETPSNGAPRRPHPRQRKPFDSATN